MSAVTADDLNCVAGRLLWEAFHHPYVFHGEPHPRHYAETLVRDGDVELPVKLCLTLQTMPSGRRTLLLSIVLGGAFSGPPSDAVVETVGRAFFLTDHASAFEIKANLLPQVESRKLVLMLPAAAPAPIEHPPR